MVQRRCCQRRGFLTMACASLALSAPASTLAQDDDLVGVEGEIAKQIACDMCGVLAVGRPPALHASPALAPLLF
jgi:hypothetical protein